MLCLENYPKKKRIPILKCPHLVDIEKRTYVKILNGGVFFMAKKGQKFMEYDNDFREKVVLDYLNSNLGYKKIAEKYFIESWKTV